MNHRTLNAMPRRCDRVFVAILILVGTAAPFDAGAEAADGSVALLTSTILTFLDRISKVYMFKCNNLTKYG